MFEAQGGDVRIVDEITDGACLAENLPEYRSVPAGFGQKK